VALAVFVPGAAIVDLAPPLPDSILRHSSNRSTPSPPIPLVSNNARFPPRSPSAPLPASR
jgi:hypothetical protein